MIKVILISGKARNGKDTVASMIAEELMSDGKRVLITHFGDLVKYICTSLFDWNGEKDEPGRSLLQYVGTDVGRSFNPDYWANFIRDMLIMFGHIWDYVLIPDTRFPNEISVMKNTFDTLHIRVQREGFSTPLTAKQQTHESEIALDNSVPDVLVINDGTLLDLKEKIKHIITEEVYGN